MRQALLGEFGFKANNANADLVLKGNYVPPPNTNPYVRKLLLHLVTPENVHAAGHIYMELKVKEYTGSGPSGLHYGHFKAMCWNKQNALFHTNMANIPLIIGYSPSRWRLADDHMEQKNPTNLYVDRFRPIIHVEADFNMNNGFIGRRVMDNAEKYDVLAQEQYGSRRGHSAQVQALNKRLVFDVLRQSKAKSCYDRILHVIVMLCARRTGLELAPILSMIDTIQLMTHQIHSAYGSSLGHGPNDWNLPFKAFSKVTNSAHHLGQSLARRCSKG